MEVIAFLLALIAVCLAGYTFWQYFILKNKYGQFLKGAKAEQIENQIKNYSKNVNNTLSQLDELAGFCAKLHKTQQIALSKTALVRFNPFGDTGGDQSFCLALLDHKDNGYVISAVHARTGTRIYCKEINDGKSKHHLSEEEYKALGRAIQEK